MAGNPLNCPRCRTALPAEAATLTALRQCPGCRRALEVVVLPAFGRGAAAAPRAQRLSADGQAACFFHAANQAVVPCDRCGRFLCALCDLPLGGEHLCPECLPRAQQPGAAAGAAPVFERSRVRWDTIAWHSLLLPFLFCWPVLGVTGIATAGLAWLKRDAPPSRLARSQLSLRLALFAGVLFTALSLTGAALFFFGQGLGSFAP
jgi:hypothetical protein